MSYNGPHKPWPAALFERVKELWQNNGLTGTEIGEIIGKSRNAVLGKLNREGLIGDGTHVAGTSNAPRPKKIKKFAPPVSTGRSRAKGGGAAVASLATVPPPPPILAVNNRLSTWNGIVAAIDTAQTGECRWPLPDGPVRATGFCGAPVASGTTFPYCPYHLWHATHYVPAPYNGPDRH